MSLPDAQYILSSQERLHRLSQHIDEPDAGFPREESADRSQNNVVRGPDGKFYFPLQKLPQVHTDTPHNEEELNIELQPEATCGIGRCQPSWTQRFTGLPAFVVCYGISGIWMTTLGSLLGSQITSLERHLGISSSKTGLILSSNEIGYLIAVLFGSHFGKYIHIPRLLSLSGIIFGLCVITMSFGRFEVPKVWQAFGPLTNTSSTEDKGAKYLCTVGHSLYSDDVLSNSTNGSDLADDSPTIMSSGDQISSSGLPWSFWLLVVPAIVGGIVKSYRIPLLTHYVETNIKDPNKSGLFLGSSFTAMVFGPPVAYLLGGYVSSLPVDLKETSMSKYDQRWVGAWWLGFLIVGVASVAFSLPIMFFPRRIRYDQATSDKKTEDSSNADGKKAAVKKVILDMPKSLSRIFRRPVYVLALVGGCIDGFAFSGWFAFSQKYIETQFNKTPQQVSLTTGIIVIFSLALGTFSGGFLTSRFKLGLRGCVMMSLAISAGTLVLDVMYLVFGCENSQVMGLGDTRTQSSQQCACNSDIFLVCGDNNVDYRSPCWAGCTNSTNMIFSNCSEINGGQVKPGLCSLDCQFFIPFLVIYCLGMLIGCSSIVPGFMIIVRSIEQRDQSLATGASAFCQTLIGFLPAPLVFGKLIDSACRLWSPTGDYCMLYDRERFRFIFNGLYIGLRAGHLVILTLVLLLVRRLHGSRDKDGVHGRESKTISPTT